MTAPVWIRGILADEYGVATGQRRVFHRRRGRAGPGREAEARLAAAHPRSAPIGPQQTLARMLADGELDAFHTARAPTTFYNEPGRVRRLFPDFLPVERDYFRRTRIFPIMHVVVIRRDVYACNPWVAQSLFKAFTPASA